LKTKAGLYAFGSPLRLLIPAHRISNFRFPDLDKASWYSLDSLNLNCLMIDSGTGFPMLSKLFEIIFMDLVVIPVLETKIQ
jgi:hypothetical protein